MDFRDSGTPAAERSLVASIAVETSWANTVDRAARTAPARQAADARFLAQADGDPIRAEHLRRAHFKRLSLKSAQARRRAKEAASIATAADQALAATDPDAQTA